MRWPSPLAGAKLICPFVPSGPSQGKRMKVIICGAGDMGGVHFETYSSIDGVSVAAVSDPDPRRLQPFERRAARLYSSSEEMIDEVAADCVSIAAPTAFHAPLAIRALSRGMNVFCEKPMARTLAQGKAMTAAAKKARKILAIGYVLRFNEAYRLAREMVMSGRLGTIGTIRTSRCARLSALWHSDVAANGGATFELLTHDLDWLAWTLGPVRRVFARGLSAGARAGKRDYTLALLRFRNGAVAHLEGSLAEAGDFYATYEIAGSGGLLSYDTRRSASLEASLITPSGLESYRKAPSAVRPFASQIQTFVDCVRRGTPFSPSPAESLTALRLASAVEKSVLTGKPMQV